MSGLDQGMRTIVSSSPVRLRKPDVPKSKNHPKSMTIIQFGKMECNIICILLYWRLCIISITGEMKVKEKILV